MYLYCKNVNFWNILLAVTIWGAELTRLTVSINSQAWITPTKGTKIKVLWGFQVFGLNLRYWYLFVPIFLKYTGLRHLDSRKYYMYIVDFEILAIASLIADKVSVYIDYYSSCLSGMEELAQIKIKSHSNYAGLLTFYSDALNAWNDYSNDNLLALCLNFLKTF